MKRGWPAYWPDNRMSKATGERGNPIETTATAEGGEGSIEDIAAKREERREEGKCRTLEDFRALAARRGYKPGWAYFRWQARSRKVSHLV